MKNDFYGYFNHKINMNSKKLESILKRYFCKQKNIDYIIRKTYGPEQTLKIYEILCLIKDPTIPSKNKFSQVIDYIKTHQTIWNDSTFNKEKIKIEEENDFMVCPYEISDGIFTCSLCGCKKIFSFSKQTRSIDEPTTVFALCSECGHKWCE